MSALAEIAAGAPGATPGPAQLAAWAGTAARVDRAAGVSIVIPIHNGPALLERCLAAVVRHGAEAEVILVDDRSTDPAIRATCDALLERHPWSTLVVERQNVGFVRAVNDGVRAAQPDHDVVALNSDTAVTAGWLRKLRTAVYAAEATASACPLSNAAGVFSIPAAFADGPLPGGLEAEAANRVLEDVAPRRYEATPAVSGFCMYLRRAALDEAGLFDERLMLRGYGEENDLCERLAGMGWQHAVDDATFVLHERAASFGTGKWALKDANSRLLKAVHRTHVERLRAWQEASQLDAVRADYARALDGTAAADRGPVTTEVAVTHGDGEAAPGGSWRGDRRRVAVALSRHDAQVDLFGARVVRTPLTERDRAALVAWLVNRWGATRLSVEPGLLEPAAVDAIAGAWDLERPGVTAAS